MPSHLFGVGVWWVDELRRSGLGGEGVAMKCEFALRALDGRSKHLESAGGAETDAAPSDGGEEDPVLGDGELKEVAARLAELKRLEGVF